MEMQKRKNNLPNLPKYFLQKFRHNSPEKNSEHNFRPIDWFFYV